MSGMDAPQPWHALDPKQGPFPGLPSFGELHTELARHRRRDPDAKLIAAYDALLVLCERITVLEAEAMKPRMTAERIRLMGGYEYDPSAPAVAYHEAIVMGATHEEAQAIGRKVIDQAAAHDPEDTALD